MASMFTLAPSDHSTDPKILEASYKCWSTYLRDRNRISVRSNNLNTAGGQLWTVIATRVRGTWQIQRGAGFLAQGGMLLARHLIQRGEAIRSEVLAYQESVTRYRATSKAYSLPTILNGNVAVVSRDKLADERAAKRKVDIGAAMAARKAAAK